jgi:hypothetical protein
MLPCQARDKHTIALLINGRLSLVSKLCTEELRSLCIASGHSISTGKWYKLEVKLYLKFIFLCNIYFQINDIFSYHGFCLKIDITLHSIYLNRVPENLYFCHCLYIANCYTSYFFNIFVICHLSNKVEMYADKTISFDGDPSRENSFVCERVYLIFLLRDIITHFFIFGILT